MIIHITTHELCQQADVSLESLQEMVAHGIAEPEGQEPSAWSFTFEYVYTVRRAARLHRDLGINWNGVALVLQLLEERDLLQAENRSLRKRLERFETD
ncbi:chaperone modulator CbpM [Gilvimarinus sp. F26214L]|uniref:chaperone modulator CbpM n=1 Tax=Gilvimarinus sp. DZF01 TaxID=3461371 RepID=UPI00404538C4